MTKKQALQIARIRAALAMGINPKYITKTGEIKCQDAEK